MKQNRSMPVASVIPELAYADVSVAAEWLATAFGPKERLRIGRHRVQLTWLDGAVVLTQGAHVSPGSLLVRVPDADAHHAAATAAGAMILQPPTDFPYGERQYTARDLAGHRWTFSETIADLDPADWGGKLAVRLTPRRGESGDR